MTKEKEIQELREKLKELSASQYRRFNVLLKKDIFVLVEKLAINKDISKAKALSEMIKNYK